MQANHMLSIACHRTHYGSAGPHPFIISSFNRFDEEALCPSPRLLKKLRTGLDGLDLDALPFLLSG